MVKINQSFMSKTVAEDIATYLSNKVMIPENRVLLYSPDCEEKVGNIIIPADVKEGKPRKGVVILSGELDDYHTNYKPLLEVGNIVTYGLYAGKEVEFEEELKISNVTSKGKFTVLDCNEIIMSETR